MTNIRINRDLCGKSRLALPGTKTGAITAEAIFRGDRFKSVIVDQGETLVKCLAYIDLNPLRAGIKTTIIVVVSTFCVTMTTGGISMSNHFFSTNDPGAIGIAWIRNYLQTERC